MKVTALNVRIGEINQELNVIYKDTFENGLDTRRSRDKIENHKGRQFMKFCDENNMLVLNGRTRGDEEGKLTFVSATGESVNDICATGYDVLNAVDEFSVENVAWSDHLPIRLTVNLETSVKGYLPSKIKYKFGDISNKWLRYYFIIAR